MDNPINLPKLKQMIKDGISSIPKDPNANEAVIVIGDTGVGKSTILAFLSGAELYVKYDGLKPIIDSSSNKIKIGHQKYSQTSIPNKILIDDIAFYDCPGFKDNKGEEYEISNSFFIQRLLDIYPKVKIVLMVDESHISEARADKLPKLTKNLLKSFKTFDDIKEGVVMIINRAERDLTIENYYKEIKKMCDLKNQRGALFEPEEQKFLNYLMSKNRITLFRQPKKEQKNQKFIPTQSDCQIMKTIKEANFVKSKHILNILSQSAKLAIRDFIDEITARSNIKIQSICAEIVGNYSVKISRLGNRDIKGMLNLKDQVIKLAQEVKSAAKEDIAKILQRELPIQKVQDFSQDFAAVMFFKGIYDKTSTYFSNLVNKIYSELSHLLVKMDTKIMRAQKQQLEDLQKQRQTQRRKQLQQHRDREKHDLMQQVKKVEDLKSEINQMGYSSNNMLQSLGDSFGYLNALEEQFKKLRQDCGRIHTSNQDMYSNLSKIQTTYIRRATY